MKKYRKVYIQKHHFYIMANIQLEAFGELFTSTTAIQRFREEDYSCPFDSRISICDKPNKGNLRYGNCSAQVGHYKRIICPRRFYHGNYRILREVRDFIWGRERPADAYDEVKLQTRTSTGDSFSYGSLDWMLVSQNIDESFDNAQKTMGYTQKADKKGEESRESNITDNEIDLIGVEIQTDATTGTGKFREAIKDLLSNNLQSHYAFGLNTLASFKGFLPQFIFKGQLFDDWKKPYVAVIQDELWDAFKLKFRIRYREVENYTTETFLFFVYKLELNSIKNKYEIQLDKVYTSRWVDFLFAFAVKNELLIDYSTAESIVREKMRRYSPRITL